MKNILYVFLLVTVISCNENDVNLELDHVNIWVKNPKEAKEKLEEIGFTAIPDSLSLIHSGQGTTGRYFYFLNGYLELIYIYDNKEFIDNAKSNKSLDFIERSNSPENGYSPFSIALQMKEYHKSNIPFKTVEYYQDWMGETNRIFVAQNSKIKKEEPSMFVVFPEIEYDKFETLEELSKIPDEYAIWREFYKHSNGAKSISKVEIHSNNIEQESETIRSINSLINVEIKQGEEYLMELYFDNGVQGKTYDLRPEVPLQIHL